MFLLPCEHFICQNCLTRLWHNKPPSRTNVICPLVNCTQDPGFSAPVPIDLLHVDRDTLEEAETLRKDTQLMSNPIVVDNKEVRHLLLHLYQSAEDQILCPEQLGGIPTHMNLLPDCPFAVMGANQFFVALFLRFTERQTHNNSLVTPVALEAELRGVVDKEILSYGRTWYAMPLERNAAFFQSQRTGDEEVCLGIAKELVQELREMSDLWYELVGTLVGLLTARHLSRFATTEEEE